MSAASILLSTSSWLVWVVLLITCTVYAAIVRWLRESSDGSSQTAWLVVVGNMIVMLATTLVIALSVDTETAIVIFFVMLLSNVFGGLPMVFEYLHWYTSVSKKRNRAEQVKRIERITGE